MKISLSEKLRQYMDKKGYPALLVRVETRHGGCCCCGSGSSSVLDIRFLSHQRADHFRDHGFREFNADGKRVLISNHIQCAEEVNIRMSSFLGIKVYDTEGLMLPGSVCSCA